MIDEAKKIAPAAYLPFKTFLSSVEALEHGLPKKLDRAIWRGQSGIVQGQIMMAFRFLGLIDDEDQPTPFLSDLVERKNERAQCVGIMLKSAYRKVFDLDLTKTSPKMLEEAMSNYGVGGDTRRKAVAFFLRAARYAEIPMHLLLTAQIRNSNGAPRRRRKGPDAPPAPPAATPSVPLSKPRPSQGETRSVALPSGTVVSLHVSANWMLMPPEERKYVFGLVDQLHQYPEAGESSEDEEDIDL